MANYIRTLQTALRLAKADAQKADAQIEEVVAYLTSEKFRNDTTVQVRDVLHRLLPVRSTLWDIIFSSSLPPV